MRDLVEDFLIEPIVQRLLSAKAIDHAVKTIRDLAKRDRVKTPIRPTGSSEAERRLGELERLVRSGVLSAVEAAPAIERLRVEVRAASVDSSREPNLSEAVIFRAAEEYRQTAKHMRAALQGKNATEGREALRTIVGSVRLMPHDDGREKYLVAHYGNVEIPMPAWLATGMGVDAMVAGAGFRLIVRSSFRF